MTSTIASASATRCSSASSAVLSTVRFVSFLAPEMLEVYEEMVRYVGRCLGVTATLAVGTRSYDVFAEHEADFGFI